MKFCKDRLILFLGLMTIEIYWPYIKITKLDIGFFASTFILYKRFNKLHEWWLTRSLVFKVFGFGLGLAWKHIDNPNMEKE